MARVKSCSAFARRGIEKETDFFFSMKLMTYFEEVSQYPPSNRSRHVNIKLKKTISTIHNQS